MRRAWERNSTTLDELADEELQAIVEDVRTAGSANREQTLAAGDSHHQH